MLRSLFPKHQGREVKSTGDGFLVEFASALAAVNCAVAIQQMLAEHNSTLPGEKKIQIRIGIHLGDVVRRENDVFGDGVNIAARIEPFAEPGGICITHAVFGEVRNKIAKRFVSAGQVELKNIAHPVEIYRILPTAAGAGETSPQAGSRSDTRSLGKQKSIAVLPFVNISSDRENEYLGDGITEDLIMALSQVKGLRVPARTSSFAFKGKNEDIRRIGQQLSVETILEGSLRKVGNRLRITAQLINVTDGNHLWSER